MKSVHILGRIDRVAHPIGIEMRRQRQLNQNAMHCRIGVEAPDQRQEICFRGRSIEAVFVRIHADLNGSGMLVPDIDL